MVSSSERATVGINLISDDAEVLVGEVSSLRGLDVVWKSTVRHELDGDEDTTIGCGATEVEEANGVWVGKDVHHSRLLTGGCIFCVGETLLHCHLHIEHTTQVVHTKVAASRFFLQFHVRVFD